MRGAWLTLVLTATLAFTLPLASSMAGAAAAAPSPSGHTVVAGAGPGGHTHVVASRRGAEGAASRKPKHRRAQRPSHHPATPAHTGWDRASVLVHVPASGLRAHVEPAAASPTAGTVVGVSKYYRVPLVLWVMDVSHGWGRVELPYVSPRTDGWIRLRGLARERTFIHVDVDLSARRLRIFKRNDLITSAAAAIGSSSSPTPPGHYAVTDRVPFPSGGYLGSFAFGISGIQPHLPAGWSGGNQLAIHGTNDPSSIGTSASAGCVRVSEATLAVLRPLLRLGTPVVIHR